MYFLAKALIESIKKNIISHFQALSKDNKVDTIHIKPHNYSNRINVILWKSTHCFSIILIF